MAEADEAEPDPLDEARATAGNRIAALAIAAAIIARRGDRVISFMVCSLVGRLMHL